MLSIINLHATVENKPILNGIHLNVGPGEIHAIMGPNGSGKSTLANTLVGKENIQVTEGSITFMKNNLLTFSPEERAQAGIFMAFQYPVALPGVTNINFLKASVNAVRKAKKLRSLDAIEFLSLVREKLNEVKMEEEFLYRSVNDGFSGGEKKRNEMLQMALLEPSLCILDETDSGLDIDALKTISEGVNRLRNKSRSYILITHYQRLLNYIIPDYVHVLMNGEIVLSGGKELAQNLEEKGYGWLEHETH